MPDIPLWSLSPPEYSDGQQKELINGNAYHEFALPGIECEACDDVWSGTRILPIACTADVQAMIEVRQPCAISSKEFRSLVTNLKSRQNDLWNVDFRPGDSFQPATYVANSHSDPDFIWATIGSVLVSEKTKDIFVRSNVTGVLFCQAVFETSSILPPVYEMVIVGESSLPPDTALSEPCAECGYVEVRRNSKSTRIDDINSNGFDICFLKTSLFILVNDKVKQIIEEYGLSNVTVSQDEIIW